MQRLEVSGAVRPIYESLGVKRLITYILFILRKLIWPKNLIPYHVEHSTFNDNRFDDTSVIKGYSFIRN